MRECALEPLQFNWFRAVMRLYNSLTQCNSSAMRKILHADVQLSSRSSDCWSSHILSAMDGLTQSYMFKQQKVQRCEPINLSRFVVDLRERKTWNIGHLFLTLTQESTTANAPLIINGVLCQQRRLRSHVRLTTCPNTCFLTCHVMSSAALPDSGYAYTPYDLSQPPGATISLLPVICVMLMFRMNCIFFFLCANPHVTSLCTK